MATFCDLLRLPLSLTLPLILWLSLTLHYCQDEDEGQICLGQTAGQRECFCSVHRAGNEGGGGTQFVNGRSRMTIDLASLLCRDGARRVFTNQRPTLLAPSAKRREVLGESHQGLTASFQEPRVRRTLAPIFLRMDDSANELLSFLVWPLQRQQWVFPCNCLVGALPYSHLVMRSFPSCSGRMLR